MAIVAYDGRKLDMLASWTGDQASRPRLGQAMNAAHARRWPSCAASHRAQLQPLRPCS